MTNCLDLSCFQFVRVRVGDLRSLYSRGLYNWNLLQFLGRDPSSYQAAYEEAMEASRRLLDPRGSSRSRSRSRTESRRSDSRSSRRSRSSTVQPSQTRTAETSQTGQAIPVVPTTSAVGPSQVPPAPETAEGSGESGSVSKRPRLD